ncbi:hypothetical protein LHV00_09945, partial [Bifidobacterium longum subsp. infantis]|uniref:hypothetical protein n=1 Tax=Bifidobacterium longum TaxID=216816 RepID=UPI001CFF7214
SSSAVRTGTSGVQSSVVRTTTPDGVVVLTIVAGADCAPVCLLLITESPLGSPFLFFEGLF